MKRHMLSGLSVLAVAAGVGWTVASRPGTSAGLDEVSLNQGSEHSDPGPSKTLAGIRVRIMPSGGPAISATADKVPQIALVSE
jgi:hypothetical protein